MFDRKAYMKTYHKEDYKENKDEIDKKNKAYYEIHKEEITVYKQEWYQANKPRVLKKQKARYKKSKEQRKRYNLKTMYGISLEEYNAMFEAQGGRCAICGQHQRELKKALHVDHNHETGKVRGLLCQKCNHAIGLLNDNPVVIKRALGYIEVHDVV